MPRLWSVAALTVLVHVVLAASAVVAQNSRSASALAARDLSALLSERRLDAVATRDPEEPDRFVAALFFPESQLLVVSARHTVPSVLEQKLVNRQYRDVYIDLHGASDQVSRIFFHDIGADGLNVADDQTVDLLYEGGKPQTLVEKGRRGPSQGERFAKADAQYARLLSLLTAELRKGG